MQKNTVMWAVVVIVVALAAAWYTGLLGGKLTTTEVTAPAPSTQQSTTTEQPATQPSTGGTTTTEPAPATQQ